MKMENNSARIENSISLIFLWWMGWGMTGTAGWFFWQNVLLFQGNMRIAKFR